MKPLILALALVLGVIFVLPIGGADVPVLISLLNSFTGLAVAASGFVLDSDLLIVAGTLVGASGTILTRPYKGRFVQVQVLTEGFAYAGRIYPSLSAVAKTITGSHTNGFHFFRSTLNHNKETA